MSRIHEALKKAELERATVQPDAPTTPLAEYPLPVQHDGEESESRDVWAQPIVAGPFLEDHILRFDDLKAHCAHPQWHPDANANIFFNSDAGGHGAEQFRTLRSRLYQLRATQPLRKLLITSSIPGEGKTFVATNLSQAIVRQPDRRVLVIDCDLRRPHLHISMGAPLVPGLTDYLRGEANEMAVIQHGQDTDLCIIAGGTEVTDPSELLSNGRLKKLIERLTPMFDWVILDSPPCLPVADANILADLCDGVLMVVGAGSTPSEIAEKACQDFRERNIVGIVLNRSTEKKGTGGYYYSYGGEYGKDAGKQP
jgi:protein-tyrosine kinase